MSNFRYLVLVCSLLACSHEDVTGTHGFEAEPGVNGCPSALLVTESDYTSTNVSVISPSGEELTDSFISSSSAPAGLTTALSGDVVFPSAQPDSGQVVLIDRFPNSVLTWLDAKSGEVQRQLNVGTGFGANPHDYVEVSTTKGYVSRYEGNTKAGSRQLDAGSDVLVINPKTGKLLRSIDLTTPDDGEFLPRPSSLLHHGEELWVMSQGLSADFQSARESRIVGISLRDDSISWTLPLDGFKNCGDMQVSPSGQQVAVGCSGLLSDFEAKSDSDVLLLDITQSPPVLTAHFKVAKQLGAPVTSALAFISDTVLLGIAYGNNRDRNDVAYTLDLDSGKAEQILEAGGSFKLTSVHCAPGCEPALCFMTDSEAGVVRAWSIGERGSLTARSPIETGTSIGLPPVGLGAL